MSRRRTFGSIRTLSSGRYQAALHLVRRRPPSAPRSFATKAEASQWLAKIETEFARGTWTDPDAGRVSLDGYARSWVETRANLRPRTVDLYESLLEHHIVPALGDHEVGTLSAGTVRRWHSQLVRRSGSGSLTPAKSYRLLRTILNTAVADGLIARNPCAIVGAGIERSAERPVATLAQVWALADAVPPHFRALVLTAAFGGLRFGELAGLTRDCVDLAAGTITVRRALVQRDDGTLQLGPPKSEAGRRTFTIPAALVPELAAIWTSTSSRTTTRSSSSERRAHASDGRTGRSSGRRRRRRSAWPACGFTTSATRATPSQPRPVRAPAS